MIIKDIPQRILSRYEFDQGEKTGAEIFYEYESMFEAWHNPKGVRVHGVSPAIAVDTRRVILLVHDEETEAFLKIKFASDPTVKINRYY